MRIACAHAWVAWIIAAALVSCGGRRAVVQAESAVCQADTPTVQRAVLIFGGDVMQHRPQVDAAAAGYAERTGLRGGYDYAETFRHLKPIFDTADMVVVNLETTLSPSGPYTGYPIFAAPSGVAGALRDCGVDVALLANNHMMDKGRRGVESTLAALDSAGVRHTGVAVRDTAGNVTGNTLYFNVDGLRFAMLNYTYGTNGMPVPEGVEINIIDTARMAADLARIDKPTDLIITCFHSSI